MTESKVQPRLDRLSVLLGDPLFESTLWSNEYDLSGLDQGLKKRIKEGDFNRIIFYGMGCSSVVSDVVKGFFHEENVPIDVEVVNDYDVDWFTTKERLIAPDTLCFIVCYSGWSVEPCMFYDLMEGLNDKSNLIVLTGGGKIADICRDRQSSVIQYKLRHADREYPLYHVQQFFSIFLHLFYKLGFIEHSYQSELQNSVEYLKQYFNQDKINEAKSIAKRLKNSRIALLSTAKWYTTLLKQSTMFLNEIAMVPTHRNLLHEFSHTEVAAYSNPTEKQSIIAFIDKDDDNYTIGKAQTMYSVFTNKEDPSNKNIEYIQIEIDQPGFFNKFYATHFFMVYVAYFLGIEANVEGRDLISIAAKNPWWSQEAIEKFPLCVDIPGDLQSENSKSTA